MQNMRKRCHETELRWRGFLLEESNWEDGGRGPASGDSSGRREVRDRQRQKEGQVGGEQGPLEMEPRWRSQWLQLRL